MKQIYIDSEMEDSLEPISDKELRLLKNLEKNQDVIYLLNPTECAYVTKLIKSYKVIKRQLIAMQMSDGQ